MTHNQDFVYATRQYASRITDCRKVMELNPQRALDICGTLRVDLSVDTRFRGHRDFVGDVENQVDMLEELARKKLYSPEQ